MLSPLIGIVGFNVWRVVVRPLQTLELGIYQYIVPSVLYQLTEDGEVFEGRTVEARYRNAYDVTASGARSGISALLASRNSLSESGVTVRTRDFLNTGGKGRPCNP